MMKNFIAAIWKFCSYLFVPRKAKRLPNDWMFWNSQLIEICDV